jgi:hypothetical protein
MALLTDAKARTIQADGPALPHGGVTGLVLHPSPKKGHGKWVLRYVSPVSKRRRNAGLGSFPEVGVALAASRARAMRDQLVHGIDPAGCQGQGGQRTLIAYLRDSGQEAAFRTASRLEECETRPAVGKHARPSMHSQRLARCPLDKIQPRDIAESLRSIWLQKPETASRVKQRLHAVMAWGWGKRLQPVKPPSTLLAICCPCSRASRPVRSTSPRCLGGDLPSFISNALWGHWTRLGIIRAPSALRDPDCGPLRGGSRGCPGLSSTLAKALWTIPGSADEGWHVASCPVADPGARA